MLRLIVSEQDYVFSEFAGAFVIPEREMGPGNPAVSPADGVAAYNAWIVDGCPGSDSPCDFENMINHALSGAPGSNEIARYLLNVMVGNKLQEKPLPECSWTTQLLFARDSLDRMDRTSFLRLRNTLMKKVGENE